MSFFSRWRNRRKKKKKVTPAPTQSKSREFAGPVQRGGDVQKFRRTGVSTPSPKKEVAPSRRIGGGGSGSSGGSNAVSRTLEFQKQIDARKQKQFVGPVRAGEDVQKFRRTGISGKRLQGEPSQYEITKDGRVVLRSDVPKQIQVASRLGGRSELQRQNLKQAASDFTPRFFTTGTVGKTDTAYISKGERQTEIELKRFNIQQSYQKEIQSQFQKSGLSVEDFKSSKQFKNVTSKAKSELSKLQNVEGFYDAPDLRTPWQTLKGNLPISSSGNTFLSSAKETSAAVQTQSQAEKIIGVGSVSQKESLTSIGRTALFGGLFALDVIAGISAAKAGIDVGINVIEKSLTEGISKRLSGLGESRVIFGEGVDVGSGQFKQKFSQEFLGFRREGTLSGLKTNLGEGLGIERGSGESVFGGTYKLKGGKRFLAKTIGADTQRTIIGGETFDISGIGIGREGGKVAGFQTSRTTGIGTFTPSKSTFAIVKPGQSFKAETFGFLDKPGQFQTNLKSGGKIITSQFKTPSFTAELPNGKLTFSGGKRSLGFSYETELSKFKPKTPEVNVIGAKKPTTSKPLFDFKTPKTPEVNIPKVKTPTRNGGLVFENTKTFKTGGASQQTKELIGEGLSETTPQISKPFSIKTTAGLGQIGGRIGTKLAVSLGLKQLFKPKQISGIKTSSKLTTGQLQSPVLASGLGDPTIKTTSFKSPTPTPIITNPIGGGTEGIGIPNRLFIPLPRLSPQIGKAGGVGKSGIGKRLFKYTPSFTALKFGIFSNKQSKGISFNGREVYSGFETRAVIKKAKKKKKKKSKK